MSGESSESPQPAPVKKGGGCGLAAWIVILAIGLAVAVVLIREYKIEQQRKAEAKTQRIQVRSTQLTSVGTDVMKAADLIAQGDVPRALDVLQSQQAILAGLANEATNSGDTAEAADIVGRREAIANVVAAVKQKQEETRKFAEDQVASLEHYFPGVAKKAAASEEAKPGETPPAPAETAPPSGSSSASSSGSSPAPAQPGEQPSGTSATPATPTPAPAPATPAPAAPPASPASPGGP